MSLQQIVEEGSQAAKEVTGLELQQSTITAYDENHWREFCEVNSFKKDSNGLFIPQARKAYVRQESDTLRSDTYHELFGHGLFTEHSLIGQELDEIKDQKTYFEQERTNTYPGVFSQRIWDYEGFAVWLEATLCEETGNKREWKKKKQKTNPQYLQAREQLLDIEEKVGRFALLAQLGFPKHYTKQTVVEVTKKLLGEQYVQEIDFLLLRGSQKPHSDIDLFSVSNSQTGELDLGWLDFYNMNKKTLEERAKMLDVHVTDAFFTGTHIYGDRNQFEQIKKQIQEQPITQEAIKHNLRRAREQRDLAEQVADSARQTAIGYANSYRANAEQLAQGNKALTLAKLEETCGALRNNI